MSQAPNVDDGPPLLRLFGVPELHGATPRVFTAERRFQLLALLGVHSGRWVPRDEAAVMLWPDRAPGEALRNLRKVVHDARRCADGLEAAEHALRWQVTTDLRRFDAALAAGRLDDALAWRRAPLLDGLDDDANGTWSSWLRAERARWESAWRQAAIARLRDLPRPELRVAAAAELLRIDAFDETAAAALIDAQLELGDTAAARRCYDAYAQRLADELGVEPARELRDRIVGAVGAGPALPRRTPQAAATAAAAPSSETSFVGRRIELAELAALLARPECRLVTILGPGGIGKSTLARRALAAFAAAPVPAGAAPRRTYWIELQDLGDVGAVQARIAQQLGLAIDDGADTIALLARRLDTEPALVVLDNAEHLAALPSFVDRLLEATSRTCLVLTSRSRTHSRHEWLLPLQGLAVPEPDSRDLDAAASFDAVRLFSLRAGAAERSFELARHLAAVIAVTEAVAGMPLAIELAASWVRLLPPEAIARELASSIDLLERDPASHVAPTRPEHRSMRAALDHSWFLLGPPEREALAALAVFEGGFTGAAARQVAGVRLPLLSALADRSLLGTDADGRLVLHPLVAAYARERLDGDRDRAARTRQAHAEHFARHLAALAPHAIGDSRRLVAGIEAEFANCRAAWQWALAQQRSDLVCEMVRAWWSFFEIRNRLREGIELLTPALALPATGAGAARALARVHHGLSMLHHRAGRDDVALDIARRGVDGAEHCGDTEAWVGCLLNTGTCLWNQHRLAEARPWFERALAVAIERADRHCTAWAYGNLGALHSRTGELETARAYLEQALVRARELGDHYHVAVHLTNLGCLMRDAGDTAAAVRLLGEACDHCAAHEIGSVGLFARLNLGGALRQSGRLDEARRQIEIAAAAAYHGGLAQIERQSQITLARLAIDEGAPTKAFAALQAAAASLRVSPSPVDAVAVVVVYGDACAAGGDIERARGMWRMAIASGLLPGPSAPGVQRRLDATADRRASAAEAALPLLDDVLRELAAEGSAPPVAR